MDCNIFRKKLEDLVEDNLAYDLREAMFEHIKDCKECSDLYKEELEIDEMFRIGLSVDSQNFRSLRSDIMKNIDKNRYGVSPVKKIYTHFRNHIATYTSLAAMIAIFVFLVPYVKEHGLFSTSKLNNMAKPQSAVSSDAANHSMVTNGLVTDESRLGINSADSNESGDTRTLKNRNTMQNNLSIQYMPKFEKKVLDKNTEIKFNTPWENSLNKKYSATVEGKGSEALEEGIGSVVVKNLSSGELVSFKMADNQKQYSPKTVKWVDDENLLVVVGLGYGTVHQGGDIYLLNIDTALVTKADPQNTANLDNKSEIAKIQSVKMGESNNLIIDVEVLVFEDNLLNINHRENRTITSPFDEIVKIIQP